MRPEGAGRSPKRAGTGWRGERYLLFYQRSPLGPRRRWRRSSGAEKEGFRQIRVRSGCPFGSDGQSDSAVGQAPEIARGPPSGAKGRVGGPKVPPTPPVPPRVTSRSGYYRSPRPLSELSGVPWGRDRHLDARYPGNSGQMGKSCHGATIRRPISGNQRPLLACGSSFERKDGSLVSYESSSRFWPIQLTKTEVFWEMGAPCP